LARPFLYFWFTQMLIEEFHSRLNGVKRSGKGWTARCPAHQDRNASLSVGVGDKGIVIKCHAGCDTEDVVKALGLELGDLFPDERTSFSANPSRNRAHVHTKAQNLESTRPSSNNHGLTVVRKQITLADYAEAKALPVEFLSDLENGGAIIPH
jgi:hypothetical protein